MTYLNDINFVFFKFSLKLTTFGEIFGDISFNLGTDNFFGKKKRKKKFTRDIYWLNDLCFLNVCSYIHFLLIFPRRHLKIMHYTTEFTTKLVFTSFNVFFIYYTYSLWEYLLSYEIPLIYFFHILLSFKVQWFMLCNLLI